MFDRSVLIRLTLVAALGGGAALAASVHDGEQKVATSPATERQADAAGREILRQAKSGRLVVYREVAGRIEIIPSRITGGLQVANASAAVQQ